MFRLLIALAGIAVGASYVLPWLDLSNLPLVAGLGGGAGAGPIVPHEALTDLVLDETLRPELPWQVWAFLGTFALAGLVGLLALLGFAPGSLAVLAGLGPLATAGYVWFQGADILRNLPGAAAGGGLPVSIDVSFSQLWELVQPALGIGIYAYFGGGLILLISGLLKR